MAEVRGKTIKRVPQRVMAMKPRKERKIWILIAQEIGVLGDLVMAVGPC